MSFIAVIFNEVSNPTFPILDLEESDADDFPPISDTKMKQTVHMLVNDTAKMRNIAAIHSIPGV